MDNVYKEQANAIFDIINEFFPDETFAIGENEIRYLIRNAHDWNEQPLIEGSEKSEFAEIISLITASIELIAATIKIYFDAKEKSGLKEQVKELGDQLTLLEHERFRQLSECEKSQVIHITVNYLDKK